MTAYVDPLGTWPDGRYCHLVADTPADLQDMANRIKMRQPVKNEASPNPYKRHLRLSPGYRILAVRNGAVEISHRGLVDMMVEWKRRHS